MTEDKKIVSHCTAQQKCLCFYINPPFSVRILRIMLFWKHTTALADNTASQETGRWSPQDVFFLNVNITQK